MAITKKIKDISLKQLIEALGRRGIQAMGYGNGASEGITDSALGLEFTSAAGYKFQLKTPCFTRRAVLAQVITLAEELDEQVESIAIDEAYEATVGSETFEATVTPRANKVTEDQALAEARTFLGEHAAVWATNGRHRVGVTTSETGRFVEDGKLIIGTGTSAAEALRDARKRHNAKHQVAA